MDLRQQPDRLAISLEAIEAATLYLLKHPEESWQAFIAGRPELEDELSRRAWRDTLPRFALRPAALDVGRYAQFAVFLEDQGLIESPPPVSSYAVDLGGRKG